MESRSHGRRSNARFVRRPRRADTMEGSKSLEGASKNLTKFMDDRRKQRRSSLANLKRIMKEVKEDKPVEIAKPMAPLKTLDKVETKQSSDTGEPSILETYATQLPNTPKTPKHEKSVTFAPSPRKAKQEVASSSSAQSVELSASKRQSVSENDDPRTILKKYARKSREAFELGKKVTAHEKELKREKDKCEKIQDNYNTLFVTKSEGEVASQARDEQDAARMGDLERKLSLAEQELVHAKSEYAKLHGQYNKTIASQNSARRDSSEHTNEELATALEGATKEIAKLQGELERRSSELGNAKEELSILREFRESVFMDQNDKTRLRGMLQKNASDLMEKDAQLSFLDGQLTASRQDNKKLREDYEKMAKSDVQKQLMIEELHRDKGILTNQVEQYKSNEEMEKQLKRELQNLAVDLSRKHEQNKQMLQQISEKEEIFHGRQEVNKGLERELALARNALKQSELEKERALEQKRAHQEELLRLRDEAGNMEMASKLGKDKLSQLSKVFSTLPTLSTLAKRAKPQQAHPHSHSVNVASISGSGYDRQTNLGYGEAARNLNTAFGVGGAATPAAAAENGFYGGSIVPESAAPTGHYYQQSSFPYYN